MDTLVFSAVSTCTYLDPHHEKAFITKTYLYNSDPLKPHFYIVKLGFTGVYIIFLISAQNHRLLVLVRTASENFQFSEVKCSIYLNRRVSVMHHHRNVHIHTLPRNEVQVHYENKPIQIH